MLVFLVKYSSPNDAEAARRVWWVCLCVGQWREGGGVRLIMAVRDLSDKIYPERESGITGVTLLRLLSMHTSGSLHLGLHLMCFLCER